MAPYVVLVLVPDVLEVELFVSLFLPVSVSFQHKYLLVDEFIVIKLELHLQNFDTTMNTFFFAVPVIEISDIR
jgi:hypothetical protein